MPKKKAFLAEHSHLDHDWLKTWEGGYSRITSSIMRDVIVTLYKEPDRHFVLDQPLFAYNALMSQEYVKGEREKPVNLSEFIRNLFLNYRDDPPKEELDYIINNNNLSHLPRREAEFTLLKKLVDEGRVEPVGGMFVQPDLNIPCGESLVRQVLVGKKRIRKIFGKDVKVGWNIDSFGHSNNLPQILKKSGIDYYVGRRGVHESTPENFYWKGLNEDKVIFNFIKAGYGIAHLRYPEKIPESVLDDRPGLRKVLDKFLRAGRFLPKVTEKMHLEKSLGMLESMPVLLPLGADFSRPHPRMKNIMKALKNKGYDIVHGSIEEYFKDAGNRLPILSGDLNPALSGVYTSRMDIKTKNREMENKYKLAETMGTIAFILGKEYDKECLDNSLELIMVNQFHDVICGCHVDEVYDRAMERYGRCDSILDSIIERAGGFIAGSIDCDGEGIVLFNQLGWSRKGIVKVEVDFDGDFSLVDVNDEEISYQRDGNIVEFVSPEIPAIGYTTVRVVEGNSEVKGLMENNDFKVEVGENGAVEITDKSTSKVYNSYLSLDELKRGGGYFYDKKRKRVEGLSSVECESGSGKIVIKGMIGGDEVVQEVVLRDFGRIDFKTRIVHDGSLSKINACFEGVEGDFYRQIPYGELETREGQIFPAVNYVRVGGVTVANKGVVEHKLEHGVLEMGLLRSMRVVGEKCMSPDLGLPTPKGMMKGEYVFEYCISKSDSYKTGEEFNNPIHAERISSQDGKLPLENCFLDFGVDGVMVSAVKKAEDSDSIVYRLFNYTNNERKISLPEGFSLVNLLEEDEEQADELEIEPFGIYTVMKKCLKNK